MKKLLFTLLVLIMGLSLFAQDAEEKQEPFKFWGSVDVDVIKGDELYFRNPDEFKLMGNLELNGNYKINDQWELNGTVVVGNYLKSLESTPLENIHHIYSQLYYLNAKYKNENWGDVSIGSFGFKVNPYVLQRVTNDDYFSNPLTQSGNYPLLGVNWKNTINNFSYNLWGGRLGKNGFDDANLYLYSYNLGQLKDTYGVDLGYDFGPVQINALWSHFTGDADELVDPGADKTNVYGGGVKVPIKSIDSMVAGNYYARKADNIDNTKMWDLYFTKNFGKFYTKLGYIYVGEHYNAPGDWMMHTRNGSGIKGWQLYWNGPIAGKFSTYGYFHKGKDFNELTEGPLFKSKLGLIYTFDENNNINFNWTYKHRKADAVDSHVIDNYWFIGFTHIFDEHMKISLNYELNRFNYDIDDGTKDMFYTQFTYSF
ncbi:MAG: hypothetical protein IJS60_00935 [Abditibacteriota bacterium]|nr:hypothetical protein [Abditibacteriota bacterium]